MSDTSAKLRIVSIGVEPEVLNLAKGCLASCDLREVRTLDEWNVCIDDPDLDKSDLILVGAINFGIQSIEVAQTFSNLCPNTPLYYASVSAGAMAFKVLTKNGFHQTFLLPQDQSVFEESLATIEHKKTGSTAKRLLRAVSLIDLEPGDPLDFDVNIYLPINNRFVKVLKEGQVLNREKFERFQSFQVSKVFIDATKMQRFYDYTVRRLKALNAYGDKTSETEREHRLQKSVRQMVLNIFDTSQDASYEEGKELLADTEKIVKDLLELGPTHDIQAQLAAALKQPSESSSRAVRVSTFAALFEMIMGWKQTQMAAIAGLFLDLGLAAIPPAISAKSPTQMNPEEREIYESHPAVSLRLLQDKRLVVAPDVQNAILQHHERLDGNGFPKKLAAPKVPQLSQLVALADRFEELTFGPTHLRNLDRVFDIIENERICARDILIRIRGALTKSKTAA